MLQRAKTGQSMRPMRSLHGVQGQGNQAFAKMVIKEGNMAERLDYDW